MRFLPRGYPTTAARYPNAPAGQQTAFPAILAFLTEKRWERGGAELGLGGLSEGDNPRIWLVFSQKTEFFCSEYRGKTSFLLKNRNFFFSEYRGCSSCFLPIFSKFSVFFPSAKADAVRLRRAAASGARSPNRGLGGRLAAAGATATAQFLGIFGFFLEAVFFFGIGSSP